MGKNRHSTAKPTRKGIRREPFHDALVPILLMLCVLPLIVRLSEYDCGYGDYLWYAGSTLRTELYSYHKSRFFVVLAVLCAGILPFRLLLYKEKIRPWKSYLPLLIYTVMVLLSAFWSRNFTAAMIGNLDSFENAWVLVGYAVVSFYTCQIMDTEKDYRIVWYGIFAISLVMAVIGGFQLFQIDFLDYAWGQKLVMTAEQYAVYGGEAESAFTGNNVYLTLYNPNYAGIFLTMLASVSGVMALTETENRKIKKLLYTILFLFLLLLTWFTYSRSTLVALAAGIVVLAICINGRHGSPANVQNPGSDQLPGSRKNPAIRQAPNGEKNPVEEQVSENEQALYDKKKPHSIHGKPAKKILHSKFLRWRIPAVLIIAAVFIMADATQGFYYLNRMLDSPDIEPLEKLLTTEDSVELAYDGQEYFLSLEEGALEEEILQITDESGAVLYVLNEGESVLLHEEDGVEASCVSQDGETEILLYIADTWMEFVYSNDCYYYVNTAGNLDQITEIPAVDFHGLEYLGSGRVYIWSRVLPILKKYLLIGSGPDTFAESFPQNDYAGKLIYANNTGRIIEKGHNDFLTKWVQTGMISSIACAVFYVFLLLRGIRACRGICREKETLSISERLRLGCLIACVCYIAGMCFNDSTIQTGPMFWIFSGIVMSGVK